MKPNHQERAMDRKQGSTRVRRMSRQLSRKMTRQSFGQRRGSAVSWSSFKTALSGWGSRRGSKAVDYDTPPVTVSSVRECVLAELEDRYEMIGQSLNKENNLNFEGSNNNIENIEGSNTNNNENQSKSKARRQVSFGTTTNGTTPSGTSKNSNLTSSGEFHIKDIDRIRRSDHFIQRYIDDANGCTKVGTRITNQQVVDTIIDVLKWRKEFGINDFTAQMFPKEFFQAGIVKTSNLRNGDIMIYVIGRRYKKIDEWSDCIIDLLLWKFDEIECMLPEGAKVRVFVDATGCGLSQADTGLLFKGVPILIGYYPGAVSKAYFYQVPWLLKPFAQMALALLPAKFKELVCFVESKTGIASMGEENVPDFMGGPVITKDFPIPDNIGTVESAGSVRGISKSNIEKMRKMVDAAIKDAIKDAGK